MSSGIDYSQIFTDLSTDDNIDREFLHELVLNIPRVAETVDKLFSTISTTSNDNRRIDLFNLLIDYLLTHELDESYDDAKISKIVENMATFPVIIKTHDIYVKFNQVLQKIYGKLTAEGKEQFVQVIPSIKAPYSQFVYSAFSVSNAVHPNQIFIDTSTSNVPYSEGLVLLLQSHTAQDIGEDNSQAVATNVTDKYIQSLLTAFQDANKAHGVSILTALLHYDNEAAQRNMLPLDSFNSYLKKDNYELRRSVLELFTALPADHPLLDTEEKLIKTMNILTTIVTQSTDKILPLVLEFVKTRQQLVFFKPIMQQLAAKDANVIGCILICVNLELLTPEIIEAAFPNNAKPARINISISIAKQILGHEKTTDAIYCALLNQELNGFTTQDYLKKAEFKNNALLAIPLFLSVYQQFGASFSLTLLNRITEITDADVFQALANEGEKLEDVKAPDVEDELLFKAFSHLFQHITPLAEIQNIISLFVQLTNSDAPKDPRQLLQNCIPADKLESFNTYAESDLKNNPRLAVLCVSVEGLEESKLEELLKFVSNDDVFTQNLGVQFYSAMTTHYFPYFLQALEKEAYGTQVTGNILVPRKKRIRIEESVRAACFVLPWILKDKELTTEQQEQLIKILYNTIPHTNVEDFTEDIKRLRPVFPLIKDVNPTEEQYKFFIDSGFIRESPYILRSCKGTPELAQQYMQLYATNFESYHYEPENIELVAKVLFNLSPTEDSLFFALDLIRKKIQPKENALKYAVYTKSYAQAANENKITVSTPRFAEFLVRFIGYTTCRQPEFRKASFAAFSAMFNAENPPTDVGEGLTQEQVNDLALRLFIQVVPKLTPEFINEFLLITHKRRYYITANGLFIRALFEARDDMANIEVFGKAIMRLLNMQPSMPVLNQFHLEKGFLSFAQRNMTSFLPLFLSSESPYLQKLVNRLLASPDHRILFIEGLSTLINSTTKVKESLILFDNLKRIVVTEETNELSVKTFASLTAEVLMWAATVFELDQNMSLIQVNQAQNGMSDVFNLITTKSSIARKSDIDFDTDGIATFNSSIGNMTNCLVEADIERLSALVDCIDKMYDSPKQTFILSAALFLIHFAIVYTQYTNEETSDLIKRIYNLIAKGFKAADLFRRRGLALSLYRGFGSEHYARFTNEDASDIYNYLLESLESNEVILFPNESILCLCAISPYCDVDKRGERRLFAQVQKGFDTYALNKLLYTGISSFLDTNNDIKVFMPDQTTSGMTLLGLFKNYSKFPNETVQVLKKLAQNDDIATGLKERGVDDVTIAKCGEALLNQYTVYPESLYDFLMGIAMATEECNDEEVKKYRTAFVLASLPLAETKGDPLHDKAVAAIKTLVH